VSTPVDGLVDLIEHGKNGFLSDDDEKLAEYLLSIIEDENLRKNLSENVLCFSEEYNDVEKYKSVIDSVLKDVVGV
jgi:glycosyltransferase involved in cell wall biosynthesis